MVLPVLLRITLLFINFLCLSSSFLTGRHRRAERSHRLPANKFLGNLLWLNPPKALKHTVHIHFHVYLYAIRSNAQYGGNTSYTIIYHNNLIWPTMRHFEGKTSFPFFGGGICKTANLFSQTNPQNCILRASDSYMNLHLPMYCSRNI